MSNKEKDLTLKLWKEMGLRERAKKYLTESGYPLELETAKAFEDAGFDVWLHDYIHREGETPSELDVVARKAKADFGLTVSIRYIIECKWSEENPWIVLRHHSEKLSDYTWRNSILGTQFARACIWAGTCAPIQGGLFDFEGSPYGRSIVTAVPRTEGGKKIGEDSTAYSAVSSCTRNAADAVNLIEDFQEDRFHLEFEPSRADIIVPVVVIKGGLFVAEIGGEGSVRVEATPHARLFWRGTASADRAIVEVITSDYVAEFASKRSAEASDLLDGTQKSAYSLKNDYQNQSVVTPSGCGTAQFPPPLIIRLIGDRASAKMNR